MADDDLCRCGHTEEFHHRSWFPGGGMLLEECTFYGYNETGGMMQDESGTWVEHCQGFQAIWPFALPSCACGGQSLAQITDHWCEDCADLYVKCITCLGDDYA